MKILSNLKLSVWEAVSKASFTWALELYTGLCKQFNKYKTAAGYNKNTTYYTVQYCGITLAGTIRG